MAKQHYPLTRAGFRDMAAEIHGMRKRLAELVLRMEDGACSDEDFIRGVCESASASATDAAHAMAQLANDLHR